MVSISEVCFRREQLAPYMYVVNRASGCPTDAMIRIAAKTHQNTKTGRPKRICRLLYMQLFVKDNALSCGIFAS